MSNRKFKKNEQHHWWPIGLSKHWVHPSGYLHRVHPDGKVLDKLQPTKNPRIGGGHNRDFRVKTYTPWNQTFEGEFDKADNAFPEVAEVLNSLPSKHKTTDRICHLGYRPVDVSGEFSALLSECAASLIIRSPRFRAQSGEQKCQTNNDDELKRKTHLQILVAENMRGKQAILTRNLMRSSRVLFLFSKGRKFIFGDGFYTTVSPHKLDEGSFARFNAFVPILPTVAVFFTNAPARQKTELKFLSLEVDDEDVLEFNNSTQIYSKSQLYYCDEVPTLTENFKSENFQEYGRYDPFKELIKTIPEMQKGHL